MAFICITPNVAMVRMNARDHLEELPGDFYINLDMLVEARMKEVREDHDGDFCADVLLVLKNKTHEFVFRNSPAGNKAKETLSKYLTERSINC
ncbi:MAG: hypothetical protein CMI08_08480 [Oceanospirillaceae bacterium]|uniref:hypothetical protein n=1 Tax=unclassified Thalassolituus TaxID=2624967 RepID=UPI000C0B4210|nr:MULTISPECIES: hypothetical protein [unclassified Thalassolituus]MAK91306.1 hypothetical protein [Thalassolituus sp.]MAX99229.1 hypothetical protein [Oceanospirillaceae bacterium]MBS51732.1 hypothetical protein [Oceanospirillaceae bacterium]|tara:strand:- start:590 stop:868 length:279 start_codon:yes stop_codon:yes gene_type:complete